MQKLKPPEVTEGELGKHRRQQLKEEMPSGFYSAFQRLVPMSGLMLSSFADLPIYAHRLVQLDDLG